MFVSPSCAAVTRPWPLTVATTVLSDCHVAVAVLSSVVPFESVAIAVNYAVAPRSVNVDVPLTVTPVTVGAAGGIVVVGVTGGVGVVGVLDLHAAPPSISPHTIATGIIELRTGLLCHWVIGWLGD
jgi:hypothetical protein